MSDHYISVLEDSNRKLRAQLAKVKTTITPHQEAWGWQCPCCAAVAAALDGDS